jgi:hypothetical protein
MTRLVLLDAGPLGLAVSPPGVTLVDRCRAWLRTLEVAGVEVGIPAVADYEVRRELIRIGATAKLRNLDLLHSRVSFLDVTADAWHRAAELWAIVRRLGKPTAGSGDLDADAILAGVVDTIGQPGDIVTIATMNLRHLVRFPGIDAQLWKTIT